MIFQISASQVARIIDMTHQCLALPLFSKTFSWFNFGL
jgi:hypothetical protein